jgi:hypothetical protein
MTFAAYWPIWLPLAMLGGYELLALATQQIVPRTWIRRIPTISELVWQWTFTWTRRQRRWAFVALMAAWGVLCYHFLLGLGRPVF